VLFLGCAEVLYVEKLESQIVQRKFFQGTAVNRSPEHRVLFLGCAEVLYFEKLESQIVQRKFFQGAAVNRSPEHRVFRAEVSC